MKKIKNLGACILFSSLCLGLGYAAAVASVDQLSPKKQGANLTANEVNLLLDTMRGVYNSDVDPDSPSDNRIGIGAPADAGEKELKLDVKGALGANDYCDENGNNCLLIDAAGGYGIGVAGDSTSSGEQKLKLDVEGPIGATKYCNADGSACYALEEIPPLPECAADQILEWTGSEWGCAPATCTFYTYKAAPKETNNDFQ